MKEALKEAKKAYDKLEVPVGVVIVNNGKIIARAHNVKEQKQDTTRHAEIIAIQKACKKTGSWRLCDCDLYVTLEPCAMCAGACINSRLNAVYFGAYDEKAGCAGTLYNLPVDERFNHRLKVQGGIMHDECVKVLSDFFKQKRQK